MMNRFPRMFRSVNEGLDELLKAMDKVNSIYQSAGQIGPLFRQFTNLLAEANANPSKQMRLSLSKSKRESSASTVKKRRSRRRRKSKSVQPTDFFF